MNLWLPSSKQKLYVECKDEPEIQPSLGDMMTPVPSVPVSKILITEPQHNHGLFLWPMRQFLSLDSQSYILWCPAYAQAPVYDDYRNS